MINDFTYSDKSLFSMNNYFYSEIEEESFSSPQISILNQTEEYFSSKIKNDDIFIQKYDIENIENTIDNKKSNSNLGDQTKPKTNNSTNKGETFLIKKIPKKNKLLGRKKKSNNSHIEKNQIKCHDKSSGDNMTRKLKTQLIHSILNIINKSLNEEEKKENSRKKILKYNYTKVFLLNIDTNIKSNINVLYNRQLLGTKIKDIFSSNICANCLKTNKLELNYNKKFIENIYRENNKKKTIKILEKTFLQCLEHYRHSKYYEELKGLEIEYVNFINEMKDEKQYIDNFKKFVNRFEIYYKEKFSRKERKKNKNIII